MFFNKDSGTAISQQKDVAYINLGVSKPQL